MEFEDFEEAKDWIEDRHLKREIWRRCGWGAASLIGVPLLSVALWLGLIALLW